MNGAPGRFRMKFTRETVKPTKTMNPCGLCIPNQGIDFVALGLENTLPQMPVLLSKLNGSFPTLQYNRKARQRAREVRSQCSRAGVRAVPGYRTPVQIDLP